MKPAVISFALGAAVLLAGCGQSPKGVTASREVRLEVTENGFEPARVTVPGGQALTLIVTRRTDQTCATEMQIPALHVQRALPLNQPVRIEIPGGVTDTMNYVCGMNMLGGTIAAR